MKPKVYDAFGRPGPHIDASTPVRRWDLGLGYAGLGFAATFTPLVLATIGARNTIRALTLDPSFYSAIDNYTWAHDITWLGLATTVGVIAGASLGYLGLIPRSNSWVVSGPKLLEGKQAIAEAKRRSLPKKERVHDMFGIYIHPALFLSKKTLSKHLLLYGSVGSGKTQILLALLQQIFANDAAKLFLYDVKGDFTAKFPEAEIVSCFDRRSRVWWVARDVRTSTQASAFADSLIPEDSGSGKFWTQAARQILLGVVRSLQNEKPETWTWTDLAQRVSLRAEEMAPILEENYRKAYGLISNTEGTTAFNVLATLNGFTKVIDDLASAWPNYDTALNGQGTEDVPMGQPHAYVPRPTKPKEPAYSGECRKAQKKAWKAQIKEWRSAMRARRAWYRDFMYRHHLFSITDWAMDEYTGPRKIIVQSGADASLAQAYISAMINVAVPSIISPQLPDNEQGRGLFFILDEMSSIGKIEFAPLVDKGRSKGVSFIAGVQDLAQLRQIYGDNAVKAIQGMVGTHIICQVQMGDTREDISRLLGTNKIARMDYGEGAKLHNEGTPVVYPNQLTDMLGWRKTKGEPGFVIRAIVQQGNDLLLLDFPGQKMPDVREGQVPAEWTTKPAGKERKPQDINGNVGRSLTEAEIEALFATPDI